MKTNILILIAVFSLIVVSASGSGNRDGNGSGMIALFPARPDIQENLTPTQIPLQDLVALVKDAAELVRQKGETAFDELRLPDSRWRRGDTYIFVLDTDGNMYVNPDMELEGKNVMDLKDINGKLIVRGLISAVTTAPDKIDGWYHYEWPVPGELLPRWKSSYVRLVKSPSGKAYVVGSGIYNNRMEKEFVVDFVHGAVGQIEKNGPSAFSLFRDPKAPFMAKDAYVFVIGPDGMELVNPGFPNLEGRNLMELKDANGKMLVRDMFNVVRDKNAGWVEYMWPKPGESVPTLKSTYVTKAEYGKTWYLVGCGVYLEDAPKATVSVQNATADEIMQLVRQAADVFEKQGSMVFPQFREKGSKWFKDDTYFFVWTMDGVRLFNAANPDIEGINVSGIRDIIGRPFGRMFLDAAMSKEGEGWIHYMYPEPGNIFPTWKSSFVKRVTFPSGTDYLIGCGIYNMQMDMAFIEDVVERAAALVAEQGNHAFAQLRDKTGPFVFMDTYVFVDDVNGFELVNPVQPSLENKYLVNLTDAKGKYAVREYIDAALKDGQAWVDYYWYRPGENEPAHKYTFVKKVQYGTKTYIVGAGLYVDDKMVEEQVKYR